MQKTISVYKNILLILLLSLAAYGSHLENSFHFDGVEYIIQNQRIRDIQHAYYVITQEFTQRSLMRASFVFNYYFGEYRPFGYHFVNLLLHISNGLLVFVLVAIARNTLCKELPTKERLSKTFIPFFSAILFIIHPIQTESVVYIMSRSELLFSFFYLSAFILFQLFLISEKKLLNALLMWSGIIILFLMAVGSKESSATFPAMIFLYYLIQMPRNSPFFQFLKKWRVVIVALCLIALLLFLNRLLVDESFLMMGRPTTSGQEIGRKNYMLTEIFVALILYIKLLLFPLNLNVDPDISVVKSIFEPAFYLPVIMFICLILWIFNRNRNKLIGFGFTWYIVTLSPTSSIIPLLDFAADHRLYLPSSGAFIMVSYGFFHIFTLIQSNLNYIRYKCFHLIMINMIIVFFLIITITRNNDWRSSVTIWEDAAKKSPLKGRPFANLGYAYTETGDIDKSIKAYQKALDLGQNSYRLHYNLAVNYIEKGKVDESINELNIALRMGPGIPEIYSKLGEIYLDRHDSQKADFYLKKAIEINPDMDIVFLNLGILHYYELKNYREAYLYFSRSLKLNPGQDQSNKIRQLMAIIKEKLQVLKNTHELRLQRKMNLSK